MDSHFPSAASVSANVTVRQKDVDVRINAIAAPHHGGCAVSLTGQGNAALTLFRGETAQAFRFIVWTTVPTVRAGVLVGVALVFLGTSLVFRVGHSAAYADEASLARIAQHYPLRILTDQLPDLPAAVARLGLDSHPPSDLQREPPQPGL